MTPEKERVTRKKNQILHDFKRISKSVEQILSEIDRLKEDIDELCSYRNGDTNDEKQEENHKQGNE